MLNFSKLQWHDWPGAETRHKLDGYWFDIHSKCYLMLEFANGVEMNTIEGIEHQSYELFTPF